MLMWVCCPQFILASFPDQLHFRRQIRAGVFNAESVPKPESIVKSKTYTYKKVHLKKK